MAIQFGDFVNPGTTSVRLLSVVDLGGVYDNGPINNGVDAKLTSPVAATLVIDGVTPSLNDRVFLRAQAFSFQNGFYDVVQVGDLSHPWILQRSNDFQMAAQFKTGVFFSVAAGTLAGSVLAIIEPLPVVIGIDPIVATLPSAAPGALLAINDLSDLNNLANAQSNLGLMQAAFKNVSDSLLGSVASVSGFTTGGNLTAFSDINGTVIDSGLSASSTGSGLLVLDIGPVITTPDIVGAIDGSNANAGSVGEYISSSVLAGAALPLGSGAAADVTSIVLSAGDWDVSGVLISFPGVATVTTDFQVGLSDISGTLPVAGAENNIGYIRPDATPGTVSVVNVGPMRVSVAVPTTMYLVVTAVFAINPLAAYGFIGARRVR